MIRLAVIGFGYWGPNIVRNFSRIPGVALSWIADIDKTKLADISALYPSVQTTTDSADILKDTSVDAAVIVTPPITHFALAKQFVAKGKHVLVEKPMTQTVGDAKKLIALAKSRKKILMVDHTFIYTPAIRYIQKIIHAGTLGTVSYVDSVRTNLGLFQKDTNVIEDLAVHDFSIMEYLFGSAPVTISATGYTQKEIRKASVAHITTTYRSGLYLHSHVSWLSPVKIRRMLFVGTKKMLIYDDIEPSEKIKIYDKGVSFTKDPQNIEQLRIGYRSGNIIVPHIPVEEGLYGLAKEFSHAVRTGKSPITDGRMGLSVVQCLTIANASYAMGGKPVRI